MTAMLAFHAIMSSCLTIDINLSKAIMIWQLCRGAYGGSHGAA